MTNLEPLRHKIHAAIIASLHGAQGAPLQTQSVHTVLSTPCTNCKDVYKRQALSISHRSYVLENGVIVDEGESKKLLASESIRTAYLGK